MTSKKQQQKRKTVPKETTQKGTKKQKTSESSASTRHSERIANQDSDLTRSTKKLKISYDSDSSSRSDYSLKDVPSRASNFTEEDIMAFNATFKPTSDENNFIPDVEGKNYV